MNNKQGLLNLIKTINGEIRNPIRLLKLNKICNKYNINIFYFKRSNIELDLVK